MHRFYSLAWIHHRQGKYESAQEMFERAFDGYTKTPGPYHQHTLNAAYAFGNLANPAVEPAAVEASNRRARTRGIYLSFRVKGKAWTIITYILWFLLSVQLFNVMNICQPWPADAMTAMAKCQRQTQTNPI